MRDSTWDDALHAVAGEVANLLAAARRVASNSLWATPTLAWVASEFLIHIAGGNQFRRARPARGLADLYLLAPGAAIDGRAGLAEVRAELGRHVEAENQNSRVGQRAGGGLGLQLVQAGPGPHGDGAKAAAQFDSFQSLGH